jgi:hypothetical protein
MVILPSRKGSRAEEDTFDFLKAYLFGFQKICASNGVEQFLFVFDSCLHFLFDGVF